MESEKVTGKNLPAQNDSQNDGVNAFKGYTLDELRYQRALITLKKEYIREKLATDAEAVRERIPFMSKNGKGLPKASGIFGKIITGMDYMDYVLLGISVFSTGKKILSFFRKNK